MYKDISLMLLLFISIKNTVSAQTLDSGYLQCSYQFNWINDSTKTDIQHTDDMSLIIGNNYTEYYSEYIKALDSALKANAQTMSFSEQLSYGFAHKKNNRITYRIIQNLKNNTLIYQRPIGQRKIYYEENIPAQRWQILADTQTIAGYKAQKAEIDFAGRKWFAWFTPEIPIPAGPWKLGGLPGLILKLNDEKAYFNFIITGFHQLQNKSSIEKNLSGGAFTKISKKDDEDLLYNERRNPVQYLQQTFGAEFVARNQEKLNNLPPKPYLPIEID